MVIGKFLLLKPTARLDSPCIAAATVSADAVMWCVP